MNICMLSDKAKKETRMPLIPNDIIELKNISTKFNFYIEKFTDRIIEEKEYISVGCKYYTNQKIDLFLSMQGLKQSQIKSNQNYYLSIRVGSRLTHGYQINYIGYLCIIIQFKVGLTKIQHS